MANILTLSDSAQNKEKSLKVYNSKEIAEKLNHKILKYLLVIHVFTGCDTTSSIYGKSKNCFKISNEVCKNSKVVQCVYGFILTRRKKMLEMSVLISSKCYMVLKVHFIMYLLVSICNTR